MNQPARVPHGKKPAAKRKTRDQINSEARDRKREKKQRGNASGSRANPVTSEKTGGQVTKEKDPRIGSKKPIALGGDAQSVKKAAKPTRSRSGAEKAPRLTPEEELAKLENDERLDALLDRLESGEALKAEDQAWLDQTLDRIDVLMEQLGIALDDDAEADDEEAEENMYRLLKGGN
ncbi:Der GTPase-activating protein YihI [Erwinia psidii]|uniref:Der GTPase-activating protein YihI n=1 Tax=Erwinia psidii TaxID=69224 RepID=A0A3N6UUC6_9GAMM|nr:Der GTPase-activating protein YihI [Erwinia psidii]MCX8959563.1 Der GTPase-activating protein YihI [Erwinia psidii]MCX8963184.1 Der GTPase-activating protein YihI [Erwinia psidii]MCX8966973.1 Der GTPase-activating protein YihI [Erwinia psidii]RQM36455.1 Der GTPase-activating protein YihI [Erwinia psidii]